MSDPEGARQGRRLAAGFTIIGGAFVCFLPFSIVTIPLGILLMIEGVRRWRASRKP